MNEIFDSDILCTMLIHASGQIYPSFYLFTFGGSSHYVIQKEDGCVLFDPGLSLHVPYIYKRMESELQMRPNQIKEVFLTHLHPERVAAIPFLRRESDFIVRGSSLMREKLSDEAFVREIYEKNRELSRIYKEDAELPDMSFEEFAQGLKIDFVFPDSEVIGISDDIRIRCLKSAGHTEESFAYVVEPYDFLVVDEGFGYFRGKDIPAPAGDWNIEESLNSIKRVSEIDVTAICFTNTGMITGQLVRNHLQDILASYDMMAKECQREDVTKEDKRNYLVHTFYMSQSRDPLVHYMFERTLEKVAEQVIK